ncbi:CPCC family cysteine-rich protein [Cellvibrio sp. BR]|uniref:CPCC family cysteine-rich protein n=1 Tax=Cellvibrio sp. BR TaxID=1134474 RepID=UPI00058E3A76|nr:CPCC family cysteine-rich protein [Cellvibrio sp. BR]
MKYSCPCCGYLTLDHQANGTFQICELCSWEDDLIQNEDPDYEGGANGICLREAQHLFLKETVNTEGYEKALYWQLLEPPSCSSRMKNNKTSFVVTKSGVTKNA